MSKIIIANWKSHPETLEEAQELFKQEILAAEKYPEVQTVICPPKEFLEQLSRGVAGTVLGAQDVFWDSKPTFSLSHVLVGHSDRRYGLRETDEVVNQKLKKALETGVTPVLLVGERAEESREDVLKNQLEKDLASLSTNQIYKILFCYEPVWAISTNPNGHADTPKNAVEAIRFIKNFLITRNQLPETSYQFLYGGSVNENDVADFIQHSEISGAVVGAASLNADQFAKILNIVNNIK